MCIHLTPSIFEMEMFRRYLVFLLPVNYERLKWKSYTHTHKNTLSELKAWRQLMKTIRELCFCVWCIYGK